MQGVSKDNNNNSSNRRWTPEDKTRIVMESLTTNIVVVEDGHQKIRQGL